MTTVTRVDEGKAFRVGVLFESTVMRWKTQYASNSSQSTSSSAELRQTSDKAVFSLQYDTKHGMHAGSEFRGKMPF